jgi:hypothetical protein
MSILTDALPLSVEIDGEQYRVRTDFRDCIRVLTACEADDLTELEKVYEIVIGYFYIDSPPNVEKALERAQWFLNGGKTYEESEYRTFDLSKDDTLIYAAFQQTHGIDLTSVSLHWWRFLALMRGLDSESDFRKLTSLRYRVESGKATKEEYAAYSEMGEAFKIDTRTPEEKEAEEIFVRLVEEGKHNREQRKK